jgi:hypothetical protein
VRFAPLRVDELARRGCGKWASSDWLALADWYHWPGVLQFDSEPELYKLLNTTNWPNASFALSQTAAANAAQAEAGWATILREIQ